MLSSSSPRLTPELLGREKVSQKPSFSSRDAPLALRAGSAGTHRLLSPAGRRRFVKHGPEVLMSDGDTQNLPWPHPDTMPHPASGLLHKNPAPRWGGQPLAPHSEDGSVPGARRSSRSIGFRQAGTGALSR